MNRSHLWKFLFVVFVIVWSFTEIYPPKARNLIDQFEQSTINPDDTLKAIVTRARELDAQAPRRTHANLIEAIGTNDLTRYLPTNYVNFAATRNPVTAALNRMQREAAGEFKLGLDLRGGTAFMMEMDTSRLGGTNGSLTQAVGEGYLVEQAIEVLRRRVDAFGVAEPVIQPAGDNRILVQLPGLSEADKVSAKEQIQKAAYLEFRMVDPEMGAHLSSGLIPPGYEVRKLKERTRDGQERYSNIIVRRAPERGLTGQYVKGARVSRDPMTGSPEISFTMTSEGADIFAEVTRANVGQSLAIMLDGEVISAPRINGPIIGGQGQITGQFTEKEAFELATALENPLRTPLRIVEERGVDPTLGEDSIRSGIKACLIGVIFVSVFMLVYYFVAGVVANIALILNMLVMLGVMCSLDVTFTLPGIAGIVLTIGMAVDANVLIYERIREELAAGKSVRGSIAAGYSKAFSTIFDSNLTTLISAVVLIVLGTGPVKGFGVSLTIGLCVSMFTALVVTRLIFDFLSHKTSLLNGGIKMLHLVRGAKIDFMRFSKPAFVLSWLLIVVGIGYGIFGRGSNMLGVEFKGGDALTLRFVEKINVDQVRAEVSKLNLGDALISYQSDFSSGKESLQIATTRKDDNKKGPEHGELVEDALKAAFPQAQFERIALEQVGPSVGREIQQAAIVASLLSLFGILVYVAFRYEFSFAVAAVVAVLHDVLMTIGWYCLTGVWSEAGRQFNATFVAAILTIIGFSINDTIVIFDRIREDLKLGVPGTFRDLMNRALNQTLSRTIITSGTTFLSTFALYLFGGGPINDFAFTFLVGIITGTYSTIYIAGALVLWWHKGQRPVLGTAVTPVRTTEAAEARASA